VGAQHTLVAEEKHGEIVARLPKEHFRALFHLLTGRPDSVTKVFHRPALVTVNDLGELHGRIVEKLAQHHVVADNVNVTLVQDRNLIKEFSWQEFSAYRWSGPEVTKSLAVRWDFLVTFPGYQLPQRHALTLRITEAPNPAEMLQFALSREAEALADAESQLAPMFCRVDFISALMSQELINIVSEWHQALPKPEPIAGIWRHLRKRGTLLHQSIHQLFRLGTAILALAVLARVIPNDLTEAVTVGNVVTVAVWLLGSLMLVDFMEMLGHYVATSALRALDSYGRFAMLRLTRGDQNYQAECDRKNRRSLAKFGLRFAGAILLNVLAGVLATWVVGLRG